MSETYADEGYVENVDEHLNEPAEREPRYEDREEPDEPRPERRREPDRDRATARLAAEMRETKRELAALRAERAAAKPDPDADPFVALRKLNATEDPIGALEAVQRLALTLGEERTQTAAEQRQQQEATQRASALNNWAQADERDFTRTQPDYPKAFKHFVNARMAELKDEGHDDPQAALISEVTNLTQRAKDRDRSPAEVIYKLATNRGYKLDDGGEQVQQRPQGQRGTSPFAGTGTRSGSGGVSVASVANAPKSSVKAILNGDDWDKGFARLEAAAKSGRRG